MLSKFKSIGLKSLSILIRNVPDSLILNSKSKTSTQIENVRCAHRRGGYRNEGKILNPTNYLLFSAFSIAYLDRKYDLFRNYFNQFTVHAKVADREEVASDQIKPANKATPNQQIKPNIRDSYNFLADAAEQAIPSVVQIEVFEEDLYFGDLIKVSCGSGFVVSKSTADSTSLVLTNSHVVLDHDKVTVLLQNGKRLTGTVEHIDTKTDLASVKIHDVSSPTLEFESSKDIRVGEFVVAIGSPLGLGNSVTAGIISSTTRRGKEIGLDNDEMKYIQTDASINLGNSGGPLISLNGKVVGISTFRVLPGINLAIPSDYAIDFLSTAKKTSVQKPGQPDKKRFFGITMLSLTPDILKQLKERLKLDSVSHGVLLVKVEPGSIAEKAGLKIGDIIIEINHKQTSEAAEIYKTIEENAQLTLLVIRGNQKIRINVSFD